jgi:16S rRNA G966 N2-methylase RsmD
MRLEWDGRGRPVGIDPATGGFAFVDRPPAPGAIVAVEAVGDARIDADGGWRTRENLLVEGENALALVTLMPVLEGRVDLVYIDPPFNSGATGRGSPYANAMAHELWLSMMEERLVLLWRALRPGGSLYVHLDENEVHYAKVLLDEIAGRESFVREIVWRIGWISGYKATQRNFVRNHDTILYYVKPGGPVTFEKVYVAYREGYRRRAGAASKAGGYPLEDTWNTSANDPLHSIQIMSFSGEKTGFATQKNEALVDRIVRSSSHEGDLVVDAFAGSGTTAAVCHKRGRRYVAIEVDGAAMAIIDRRLRAVVAGSDRHGVTAAAGWTGGGGYVRARATADA